MKVEIKLTSHAFYILISNIRLTNIVYQMVKMNIRLQYKRIMFSDVGWVSDYVLKEKKKTAPTQKNTKNWIASSVKENKLSYEKKNIISLNGKWRRERRFAKRKKNVFQLKHLSRTHLASVQTLILRDEEKMEKTSFNSFHSLVALKWN